MSSALQQLPPEIIELILPHLSTRDLLSLRLTCSILERKTLHFYQVNHFTVKTIVFTRYNIQNLVDVARHVDFGPQVRELVLVKRPIRQAALQHPACSYGDVKYVPYILDAEERLLNAMNHLPNLLIITCSETYHHQPISVSCHLRILLTAIRASNAVHLNTLTLKIPHAALLGTTIWPVFTGKKLELGSVWSGKVVLGIAGVKVPNHKLLRTLFPLFKNREVLLVVQKLEPVSERGGAFFGQLSLVSQRRQESLWLYKNPQM